MFSRLTTSIIFAAIFISALMKWAPAEALSVSSVALVEASNAKVLSTVANGATINLSSLPTTSLSMQANTSPSTVGSVKFVLDGTTHVENDNPYSLCGDKVTSFTPCAPLDVVGKHTLVVTAYSGTGNTGTASAPLTISFTVAKTSTGASTSVVSFTLIDATNAAPIAGHDPIADGAKINLSDITTKNLSIRANTSPSTVGSVKFTLDNSYTHDENSNPYSLCGDSTTSYTICSQLDVLGAHTLSATSYSGSNLSGTAGTPYTISFTIESTTTPPPPTTPVVRQTAAAYTTVGQNGTSLSVTFSKPTLKDSAIWVVVSSPDHDYPEPFVFHVTDTQENSFEFLGQQNDFNKGIQSVAHFIAITSKGDSGSTGDTVKFTMTANGVAAADNYLGIFVVEVTGVSSTSYGHDEHIDYDPAEGANKVSSGPISSSGPIFTLAVSMNADGGTSDESGSGYPGPTAGTGLTQQGDMFWKMDTKTALATFATGTLTPSGGNVTAYFNASPVPSGASKNEYVTVAVTLH